MTSEKKNQKEILKELRGKNADIVANAQEMLKTQNAIRREITKVIKEEAHTVPEIAQVTGMDTKSVLWHITAMKKYDQVEQKDMDGEYFTYQVAEG
ncbi:MAG: hypothetical protein JXA25_10960 [Anaerolineales bacterium]|nr:hypothetical protein [Anaerolineales bacterium]